MQAMGPNVAPVAIQAYVSGRCSRARGLKYPLSHQEARVGRHHLDAGHPFGRLAPLARRQLTALIAIRGVDVGDHGAGAIRERFRGP